MSESRSGLGKGCVIAVVVVGMIAIVCGGLVTWAGYAVWTNPNVQRGVAIAGAAMDMTREALTAPGTVEMRQAGCAQAMAFTPELMARFLGTVVDGGAEQAPGMPLVMCAMQRGAVTAPTCEEVVRAYAGAVSPAPPEVAARVAVQGERTPRCEGVYGADGSYRRDMDEGMRRSFGQVGTSATGAP